jgi:hypothetical protein
MECHYITKKIVNKHYINRKNVISQPFIFEYRKSLTIAIKKIKFIFSCNVQSIQMIKLKNLDLKIFI